MSWQIAVILTGILAALSQVVGKRQVGRMSAFQSGVIRDVTVLGMVGVMCLWQGGVRLEWQGIVILVMGVLESVAIAAYFAAQRSHMAATAVFSYPFSQLLIVLLAGIFFAEWKYFDIRHTQGIFNVLALIVTMILMVFYQSGDKRVKGKLKWSWLLTFSALIVAVSNIESKWAMTTLQYSPAAAMLYEFVGIVSGGLIYVYGKRQGMRVGWINLLWGIVQGLLFGVATIWYMGLLKTSPLTLASLIRRVTIVLLTASAGLWGYGEGKAMGVRQWVAIGMGLIVFGLVMGVNGQVVQNR